MWSISIVKDRRYPKHFILCVVYFYLRSGVAQDFGGVSQIKLFFFCFFFWQNVTKQYYDLPQKVPDCVPSTVKLNELSGTIVLNIVNFKSFCDVRCANELIDLWWMNGELWLLYYVFVTNSVSRFVANLRIGRISSNLKKKRVFSYVAIICELGKLVSNFK